MQGRPGKRFVTKGSAQAKRKYGSNFTSSSTAYKKFAPKYAWPDLPLAGSDDAHVLMRQDDRGR